MKFTFVIPCYKSSNFLPQCLSHIFDQDYKNFEVIVVLDGEDKYAETICKSYGVRCETIEHGGVQKARNHGLKLATGDFTLFTDADMYWNPGILRVFKEALEKTGADFAYSGYKWENREGGHIPMNFDPILFNVMNFVDGSNPVRTELVRKVGGWDESLKRFQDWDLWLKIVKAGGKGVKIDYDIAKSTEYPTEENISKKYNYEEWYWKIREKHNLPDNPVCFTSIAARGHALRIAKLCGWDYWPDPKMVPLKYKAIHLLGFFPESVNDHTSLFLDGKTGLMREAKIIVHWIGTDVLNMFSRLNFAEVKALRDSFKKRGIKNFAQSRKNAEELKELGFDAEVLPLPVYSEMPVYPLPKDFTVAVYDHDGIDQKYHKWLIVELSKAMPDVKFIFYGHKYSIGKDANVEWLGRVPIEEVIQKSSCLLRITPHDGYPVAPVEFMFSGRKVITNVEDMKFTDYVDLGDLTPDRYHEMKSVVLKKIREVQKNPVFNNVEEVKAHYKEILNPEKFKARVLEVINEKS